MSNPFHLDTPSSQPVSQTQISLKDFGMDKSSFPEEN